MWSVYVFCLNCPLHADIWASSCFCHCPTAWSIICAYDLSNSSAMHRHSWMTSCIFILAVHPDLVVHLVKVVTMWWPQIWIKDVSRLQQQLAKKRNKLPATSFDRKYIAIYKQYVWNMKTRNTSQVSKLSNKHCDIIFIWNPLKFRKVTAVWWKCSQERNGWTSYIKIPSLHTMTSRKIVKWHCTSAICILSLMTKLKGIPPNFKHMSRFACVHS